MGKRSDEIFFLKNHGEIEVVRTLNYKKILRCNNIGN